MKKTLPIYNVVIDENILEQGVSMISLVDEPAIMVDWVKLAEDVQLHFAANKDKQLLYGPFLIPDMLIYRADAKLGEYYIRFSKEQIAKIAEKFNSDLNNNNLNFQHSDRVVEGSVVENWIIDDGADKSQNFKFDLPQGTWFGGVKVKDEKFWNQEVKTDKVKGFSVEIRSQLEVQLTDIKKINVNNMTSENKLATANTAGGSPIYFDGTLGEGTKVFLDEAMTQDVPNGEIEMEDGSKIYVENGAVTKIETGTPAEAPAAPEQAQAQLSREDVATMIDARFQDIMNEITSIKEVVSPLMNKEEANQKFSKVEDIQSLTKKIQDLEEKLGLIPAAPSIKNEKSIQEKNFISDLEKVREFAKAKGEQK